jgi:hypothetical protein
MTAHVYTRCKNLEFFKSEFLAGIGIVSIRMQRSSYRYERSCYVLTTTYSRHLSCVYPRRTYCDIHTIPVDEREELSHHLEDWDQGVGSLNPEVAVKITSNVVLAILARLEPEALEIPIDPELRIQVVEKISHLGTARKHQYAAFVREENCLVFWSDDISTVVEAAEKLEARMVQYVWLSSKHKDEKRTSSLRPTLVSVNTAVDSNASSTPDVEKLSYLADDGKVDPWQVAARKERRMRLYAPIITGAGQSFPGLGRRLK